MWIQRMCLLLTVDESKEGLRISRSRELKTVDHQESAGDVKMKHGASRCMPVEIVEPDRSQLAAMRKLNVDATACGEGGSLLQAWSAASSVYR